MKIAPFRHDFDMSFGAWSGSAFEHPHQSVALARMAEAVRRVAFDQVSVGRRCRQRILSGEGPQQRRQILDVMGDHVNDALFVL